MTYKHYVVYDAQGMILRVGNCPTEALEMQAQDGEIAIESLVGEVSYKSHYVLDGNILEYTAAEYHVKNNLPRGFIWQMPERIAVDIRLLAEAKAYKWTALKAARTVAEAASFTCDGSVYQADKERISGAVQLALLAQLAGQPFSIDWTLSDNSVRTLDAAQMIAVGVALGTVVSSIFDTARQLRIQLDAANTVEEVDAIGWPV